MAAPCVGWIRNDGALFFVDEEREVAQALTPEPNARILFNIPDTELPKIPFDPTPYFERVDRELLLPAPPPRTGDIWLWGRQTRAITEVHVIDAGRWDVMWSVGVLVRYVSEPDELERIGNFGPHNAKIWPPTGGILIGTASFAAWAPESLLPVGNPDDTSRP